MRCSICKTELVRGQDEEYETIMDHVSDPNAVDYPLRPTFVCSNSGCPVYDNSFWDSMGEFFTLLDYDDYLDFRANRFADGVCEALGSPQRAAVLDHDWDDEIALEYGEWLMKKLEMEDPMVLRVKKTFYEYYGAKECSNFPIQSENARNDVEL